MKKLKPQPPRPQRSRLLISNVTIDKRGVTSETEYMVQHGDIVQHVKTRNGKEIERSTWKEPKR